MRPPVAPGAQVPGHLIVGELLCQAGVDDLLGAVTFGTQSYCDACRTLPRRLQGCHGTTAESFAGTALYTQNCICY